MQRSDKSTAPVEDGDGGIPADRTSRPGAPARNRMPAPLNDAGRADPTDPGSEQRLLNQVRRGSASAVAALFERYAPWLRIRARGRLPQWARSGGVATSDLVQDVLHHTFARLTWFESKHVSALRAYLRRAVENRVQDELRREDIARLAPGVPSAVWTSPASPLGRTPCGPSRTRRHSISDACGRSCGGVTGTA